MHTTQQNDILLIMLRNKKGEDFASFSTKESWSFVEVPSFYRQQRRPIPEELLNKRKAHMQKMYNEGTPYSWIAKFYELDRAQVLRIIKGIPNN